MSLRLACLIGLLVVDMASARADSDLDTFITVLWDAVATDDRGQVRRLAHGGTRSEFDAALATLRASRRALADFSWTAELQPAATLPTHDPTINALLKGQRIFVYGQPLGPVAVIEASREDTTVAVDELPVLLTDNGWRWLVPTDIVAGPGFAERYLVRLDRVRADLPLVDIQPVPTRVVSPVSPPSLVQYGAGCARLAFVVGADGVPVQVRAAGAPTSAYGDAARRALKQWRFAPMDEAVQAYQLFSFRKGQGDRQDARHVPMGDEPEACLGLDWPN